MNVIEKFLWRWQSKSKISSDKIGLKYTAIRKLGEIGNPNDLQILLPYLNDPSQLVRNATSLAIREMVGQNHEIDNLEEMRNLIVSDLESSTRLIHKLGLIEVIRGFPLALRESLLAPLIVESQSDLQYAVISSIEDTSNLEILDHVLDASNTPDLVLRRIALQTWYKGIANQQLEKVQEYITPRLHYLVRAVYELGTDGEFLKKALSFARKSDLPHPKAYPDFMIRYMTELLGRWDYDPDAYRSLHAILVPSYFTFQQDESEERPYIQL